MTRLQQTEWCPALKATFPHMFPVLAGSVEFVSVNMLLGAFHPFQAFAMMLMINALCCLCSGSFDSEVDLCTISGIHGTAV